MIHGYPIRQALRVREYVEQQSHGVVYIEVVITQPLDEGIERDTIGVLQLCASNLEIFDKDGRNTTLIELADILKKENREGKKLEDPTRPSSRHGEAG